MWCRLPLLSSNAILTIIILPPPNKAPYYLDAHSMKRGGSAPRPLELPHCMGAEGYHLG